MKWPCSLHGNCDEISQKPWQREPIISASGGNLSVSLPPHSLPGKSFSINVWVNNEQQLPLKVICKLGRQSRKGISPKSCLNYGKLKLPSWLNLGFRSVNGQISVLKTKCSLPLERKWRLPGDDLQDGEKRCTCHLSHLTSPAWSLLPAEKEMIHETVLSSHRSDTI